MKNPVADSLLREAMRRSWVMRVGMGREGDGESWNVRKAGG